MIGVVGTEEAERIGDALERTGATTRVADANAVAEVNPDVAIAVGEAAAIELVTAGADAPLLPVEAGIPRVDVTVEEAVAAAELLARGAFGTRRLTTLDVSWGADRTGRALFDAMLVTSDPARISEYRIVRDDPVDQFRADGIVIATPSGSHGYARAAGSPIVETESAAAVVPIAAFRMERTVWTFGLDERIRVDVTREETGVSLLLDGRSVATVPPDDSIEVRGGPPQTVVDLDWDAKSEKL